MTEGEGEGENEEGKRLKRTKTECAVEDKVHKVFHNTNADPLIHDLYACIIQHTYGTL